MNSLDPKTTEALRQHSTDEKIEDHKLLIYQVFTRLFGNKKTLNKTWGTLEENGVGKFADFTDQALQEIKNVNARALREISAVFSSALASEI